MERALLLRTDFVDCSLVESNKYGVFALHEYVKQHSVKGFSFLTKPVCASIDELQRHKDEN